MRTRRGYHLMLLGVGIVSVAVALLSYGLDALERADLDSVDARFSIRGDRQAPEDLVFVEFDDSTFTELKTKFPFPRGLHAMAIDNLKRDGAEVIAYDVQFTEPGPDPKQDDQLIESVRSAGNVVLPSTEVDAQGGTRIFGGDQGLAYSRAVPSEGGFPNDPGGTFRRLEFEVNGLPSFSLAAAELARGGEIDIPEGDSAWIDFAGPPGAIERIPFWQVVRNEFPPGAFRDKIVVVGASAPSLQDLHPTSTTGDDPMPGPEIQANAIDTALRGFPLSRGPWWVDVLLILIAGLAAPLLATRIAAPLAVLATAGIAAVPALLAQLLFNGGTIVSVVYPGLAAGLSVAGTVVVWGMATAFERARTRDIFARFVPESVVGQVLDQAEGARLGGEGANVTVLFSDLRGFTSFSEGRQPARVIEILNRYLTAMSDAILDHGGTLVTYMGDGIMAVFGAPVEQADNADRALAAAKDMLRRMEDFNRWLREEEQVEGFKMGVGLNSGAVMSGNVGSERRLEYTAIGDTTNTAARIEGMTKGTPHQLYLSDSTRAALRDPPDELTQVGAFEIRGRAAKVQLWTLPSTDYGQRAPAETEQPVT